MTEESNVKSFNGGPIGEKVVDQDVVDNLQDLINRAKAGELIGVICVGSHANGDVGHMITGNVTPAMLGELYSVSVDIAVHRIHQ